VRLLLARVAEEVLSRAESQEPELAREEVTKRADADKLIAKELAVSGMTIRWGFPEHTGAVVVDGGNPGTLGSRLKKSSRNIYANRPASMYFDSLFWSDRCNRTSCSTGC
jgi:hypothetical protein